MIVTTQETRFKRRLLEIHIVKRQVIQIKKTWYGKWVNSLLIFKQASLFFATQSVMLTLYSKCS